MIVLMTILSVPNKAKSNMIVVNTPSMSVIVALVLALLSTKV